MSYAEAIEATVANVTAELSNKEATLSGIVWIATPEGFVSFFLVPRLSAFLSLYPDAILQLVPLARSFSPARRETNIAIMIDRPMQGRLTVKKLTDYSVSLYASRRYLQASGAIRSEEGLADRTLVTFVDDLVSSPSLDYAYPLLHAVRNRFECVSSLRKLKPSARVWEQALFTIMPLSNFQTWFAHCHPSAPSAPIGSSPIKPNARCGALQPRMPSSRAKFKRPAACFSSWARR